MQEGYEVALIANILSDMIKSLEEGENVSDFLDTLTELMEVL